MRKWRGQLNQTVCTAAAMGLMAAFAPASRGDLSLPSSAPADIVSPVMLDNTMVNPSEAQKHPDAAQPPGVLEGGDIVHPWELQPTTVEGQKALREEQTVGSYGQPVWTVDRRFAETRVYVRPEGSLEFEYWLIPTIPRRGPTEIDSQFELEFGLPYRIQLDLYLTNVYERSGGKTFTNGSIEFRYALADWNKIWGNPTLYIEWEHQDEGPDILESKILFGGDAAPRWHWGWDLTFEHAFGDDYYDQYETTAGLSYTLVDNKVDIGAEFKLQEDTFHDSRSHFHDNVLIGPSIQWRPSQRMHIDFTPFVGLTHESDAAQIYVIVGWEF